MRVLRSVLISLLLLPTGAFADYAWIAEYNEMLVRGGFNYNTSKANFGDDSFVDPIQFSGQTGNFADKSFWVDSEYGIAKDWSATLRLALNDASFTSDSTGTVTAGGGGFGDIRVGTKWRLSRTPLWTLETFIKVPTGIATPAAIDEIVPGDGNLDVGVKAHYGVKLGDFFVSGSPGFLFRSGGYSSAFTADTAMQLFIYRAYMKFFINSIFSFSSQSLTGNVVTQDAAGAAGSYLRLAASPTGISTGLVFGVLLTKTMRLEAGINRTVWGQRFPDALGFNVCFQASFDFGRPDLRPKLREVPFEGVPPSDL